MIFFYSDKSLKEKKAAGIYAGSLFLYDSSDIISIRGSALLHSIS